MVPVSGTLGHVAVHALSDRVLHATQGPEEGLRIVEGTRDLRCMTEGRVGDCMVNVDQRMDPSSSLGGCGGHGADDGYCEVRGSQVRACFHDRCWAEDAQQCGEWGTTSSVDLWMDVTCEISDTFVKIESEWEDFQTFGPSAITQIEGENSLLSNGWTIGAFATKTNVSRCAAVLMSLSWLEQ